MGLFVKLCLKEAEFNAFQQIRNEILNFSEILIDESVAETQK